MTIYAHDWPRSARRAIGLRRVREGVFAASFADASSNHADCDVTVEPEIVPVPVPVPMILMILIASRYRDEMDPG